MIPALGHTELVDLEELSQVLTQNAESLEELDKDISTSWIDHPLHRRLEFEPPLS